MSITFQSVFEYGLDASAALMTEGFTGYFVPIQVTAAGLLAMVRQDSVDLTLSRVILHKQKPVGIALIARRGWTSRLAAMGIVPDARGQGVGAVCVKQLLDEANTRGDRAMVLEVIEQNEPGVRLYQKCGFQIQRRLLGFEGQPQNTSTDASLKQVDIRDVARLLIAHGPDDLPWQLSGETLAHAGPPSIAYTNDASFIVISNPDAPAIAIRAIVTLPDARRQGHATQLLRAIFAQHPGKAWRIPAYYPEETGGLFTKVGLVRGALSQWQMRAAL